MIGLVRKDSKWGEGMYAEEIGSNQYACIWTPIWLFVCVSLIENVKLIEANLILTIDYSVFTK